jgi:hypothetical protein
MVALAGLEALITPVVEDCDKNVEEVLASQASLATNIDRLTRGTIGRSHTCTRCTCDALAQGQRATVDVVHFSGGWRELWGAEEPPGGAWPQLSTGGSLPRTRVRAGDAAHWRKQPNLVRPTAAGMSG